MKDNIGINTFDCFDVKNIVLFENYYQKLTSFELN